MKQILNRLIANERLSRIETREIMQNITAGKYSDVQISSFLTTLLMRGIQVDELLGLRDGLLETAQTVDLSPYKVIDIVGTGGDGKNTFNISTCSCFVVAGAGYKVAKHGNYGATSVSGASTVLEAHGARFVADGDRLKRSLEQCGFTYLHAPLFAQGMKSVAMVRRAIQIATSFNLLGPLINPCHPDYQLLGVARLEQMRLYSLVYRKLNIGFGIVNTVDGYDEISLTDDFKIITDRQERILTPEDLGMQRIQAKELYGGDSPEEARNIFDNILENRATAAQKNVVVANAAFAIQVMEPTKTLAECMDMARTSLESGRALDVLKRYLEINS